MLGEFRKRPRPDDHGEGGTMRRTALWWLLRRSATLRRTKKFVKRRIVDRPLGVPASLGVDGLIAELDRRGCRYVVLRWFDDLPRVDPEGDIEILVEDEHAPVVRSLLTRWRRRVVPCDVYSVHGGPGFAYHRYAYFPPAVASQILDRAVRHSSGAYVPCPEDHFYSLAFYTLYHRGFRSGLPVSRTEGPRGRDDRHDYAEVLRSLAAVIGLSVPITMADLDRELERRGWRPPPDTMLKWAVRNPWCRMQVQDVFGEEPSPPGLTVFFVREAASNDEAVEKIEDELLRWGFRHLASLRLDEDEAERASRLVRGGNWGRGPWPKSGGPPRVLVVAVDPSPTPPSAKLLERHPGVDNGRIFDLKQRIRRTWNDRQHADDRCNIVHTSDSAAHAVHYLRLVAPARVDALVAAASRTDPKADHRAGRFEADRAATSPDAAGAGT
jgi:hypothetical protein